MCKDILIFTAHWCNGCQSLKTYLKSRNIKDNYKITYINVETSTGKDLAKKHNVKNIPHITYKNNEITIDDLFKLINKI